MKLYPFLLLAIIGTAISGCSKNTDCGCAPPLDKESSWKITGRSGGFNGRTVVDLSIDQQNSILTLKPNSRFICTNTQTGMVVNGTVTASNFKSIYGDMQRFVFSPQLPMLSDDFYILVGSTENTFTFGDNLADGYATTFSRVNP